MAGVWDEESEAARIVSDHLGGISRARDPGGGATSVHDFDVVLPGDRVVAVEVTRHTVAAEIESRVAVQRRDWRFEVLRYDWVVDMIPRYSVREVHHRLPSLLSAVEVAGVESFDLKHETPSGAAEEALVALRALGARLLYRLTETSGEGGKIILGAAPVVGSTASHVVVEIAQHHANLMDNARKLASAVADERHLFIWVESPHPQAVAAMAIDVLPEGAPNVPGHIDTVWVATGFEISQVWWFVRDRGWEALGTRTLETG